MAFDRSILEFAEASMPHTGYLIKPALLADKSVEGSVMGGRYFDCGTPREYLQMLDLTT
jgi:hypothetical protein